MNRTTVSIGPNGDFSTISAAYASIHPIVEEPPMSEVAVGRDGDFRTLSEVMGSIAWREETPVRKNRPPCDREGCTRQQMRGAGYSICRKCYAEGMRRPVHPRIRPFELFVNYTDERLNASLRQIQEQREREQRRTNEMIEERFWVEDNEEVPWRIQHTPSPRRIFGAPS